LNPKQTSHCKNRGELESYYHDNNPHGRRYYFEIVKPGDPGYEAVFLEWAVLETEMSIEESKECFRIWDKCNSSLIW